MVALLAQASQAKDVFGDLTRQIVVWFLSGVGVAAADKGSFLVIGRLEVPWSRDCAGLNLLVILLAVTIWLNRNEPLRFSYWVRLAAMVPAALSANIARIFTIIAYRHWFYPAIESPQLHYFFGLLWLVPFATLVMPRDGRPRSVLFFELLHAASVVALLSPMVDGPGGIGLSIAVVFNLAHCRMAREVTMMRVGFFALWLLAAAAITWVGMESFWMPWLLVCPLLADPHWILRPTGALLILASHPMFTLIPGGEILTWAAICLAVWKQLPGTSEFGMEAHLGPMPRALDATCMAVASAALVLPFLSSSFGSSGNQRLLPPDWVLKKEIPGAGYQIQLPEQSEDIGLFWYMPSGMQRHHTLRICMKYRGIDLRPSGEDPNVMTDGQLWMREFFIQDGQLINSHLGYVMSTLGPGKSPGIHLIFVTSKDSMSAADFDKTARKLALRLVNSSPKEKEPPHLSLAPVN